MKKGPEDIDVIKIIVDGDPDDLMTLVEDADDFVFLD
jgi:hypothetical protein